MPDDNDDAVGAGNSPASTSDGGGVDESKPDDLGGAGRAETQSESPEAPPPPPPPKIDWRDKRIAQLTAQLKAEREKQIQIAGPAGPAGPAGTAAAAPTSDEIEIRARELSAQQEFLRQCDDLQRTGRQQFGQSEFDARTDALRQLVDPNNIQEAGAWNALLVAARETGNGAQVLYDLGADLGEAQRLLAMPPVRMAVELTKKSRPTVTESATDEVLPKPIRPIGGRGPTHQAIQPDDAERADQLDIATWMSRRRQQVKTRGIR